MGVEFYLMGQWHFLFARNSNVVCIQYKHITKYVCVCVCGLIKRVYTVDGNICAIIEVEYGSYMVVVICV